MKSFSNDIILNCIEEIPQETRDDFLLEFCHAIQKRKDELISMNGFDPFPDNYDTKTPKGIDPIRYMIAQKILGTALQEKTHIEPDSTEAALQRVEELKRKYTPEQIVEMRKLRAEVESMLSEFEKVEENDREKVLAKYGITKFQGRRVHGDPVAFIRDPKNGYVRFLDVLFKAEVRRVNKTLADALREVLRNAKADDPLMTEDQYTEMVAAGIFGDERQQQFSMAMVKRRQPHRELQRTSWR